MLQGHQDMHDNNMSFLEHQGCFPKGSDCYDLESASESENKSGIRRVPRQLCTLRFYESDDDRPGPHSGADSACSSPPEAPDDRDQTKLGPLDGGENRFSKAHGINPALFDAYISAQKGASSPPPGITLPALPKPVDADRTGVRPSVDVEHSTGPAIGEERGVGRLARGR
ncbi:hypothetical protein VTK26DRAFT_3348 [Humicola hyalothermophila]